MRIQIKRLPHAVGLPAYAHQGDAGFDLMAAVNEPVVIYPGRREVIPTGLCVAVKPGFEIQIRPRSGLAAKEGITILNSPGTVDACYRGEIKVILHNANDRGFLVIHRGMRIAQGVLCPVYRAEWEEVTELPETARGEAGFGSTGLV